MAKGKGNRIQLSNGRRMVNEVIRAAGKMQMATYARDFDLSELGRLRKQARPRISWNVLYLKAYSIVSTRTPELRQCYVGFPWPHIYQHEDTTGSLTLEREFDGETRLLFAKFSRPERKTLVDLEKAYANFRKAPVMEVRQFQKQVRFARLPFLLRRFTFWMLFNLWPRKRVGTLGTFGMTISTYNNTHVTSNVLGPNTTMLGIDILPKKGIAKFTLTFDHQVLDGVPVIKIIEELYRTLNNEIREELEMMKTNGDGVGNK